MSKKKKPALTPNYCGHSEEEIYGLYKVKASPFFWREKAEGLKYAADKLWPIALKRLDKISLSAKQKKKLDLSKLQPDLFPVAKGLLGFSLECLMKASIIRDNPNFMDNGQQDGRMKNHNLLELANLGNIPLNSEERYTCQSLTDTMYVDFRYPVDQYATIDKGSFRIGKSIIEVGNELYARLHADTNQIHTAKGDVIKFTWTKKKKSSSKNK